MLSNKNKLWLIFTAIIFCSNDSFSADGNFYLIFPLPNRDINNVMVNTIFDHSTISSYCPDDTIVAYNGQEGKSIYGRSEWNTTFSCGTVYGYKKSDGSDFTLPNGNYAGAGSPNYLFYDGHPGYDYRTTDQSADGKINVLAAADGIVSTISDAYNTTYIDHGNGYRTYYLHLSQRKVTNGEHVVRSQVIGISGDAGVPGVPHLHFEVRKNVNGTFAPVDPYGWKGSGTDPYTKTTNIDLWTHPAPQNQFLTYLNPDPNGDPTRIYWIQNNKRYHVVNVDVLNTMKNAGIPGWNWPSQSNAIPDSFTQAPEFISADSASNGLYIQGYPKEQYPTVYIINNGNREYVSYDNCVQSNCWPDIIEVPQSMLLAIMCPKCPMPPPNLRVDSQDNKF